MPPFPTNAPVSSVGDDIGRLLNDIGISSNPSNYFAATGIGKSLTGNKLSAWVIAGENITSSGTASVVVGIDHLWFGGRADSANMVSGGLSLKAPVYPLRAACKFLSVDLGTNTWGYKFQSTLYATTLVATPLNGTSNDGGLAAINRVGANLDIYNLHGFEFGIGFDYGNRVGAGAYSGNWLDAAVTIRKGF